LRMPVAESSAEAVSENKIFTKKGVGGGGGEEKPRIKKWSRLYLEGITG